MPRRSALPAPAHPLPVASPRAAARLELLASLRGVLSASLRAKNPATPENYRLTQLLIKVCNAESEAERQALKLQPPTARDLAQVGEIWRALQKLPGFKTLCTGTNLDSLVKQLKG